jgi:hypothetical protein
MSCPERRAIDVYVHAASQHVGPRELAKFFTGMFHLVFSFVLIITQSPASGFSALIGYGGRFTARIVSEETKKSSPIIIATNVFFKTTRGCLLGVVRSKIPCTAVFLSPACPTPVRLSLCRQRAFAPIEVSSAFAHASHFGNGSFLHGQPDTLQHEPSRFLSDAETAVKLVGTDSVLAVTHEAHCHSGWCFHFSPRSTETAERSSRKS